MNREDLLKGSLDIMTPLSHFVHFKELKCVPSSVGSAHRAQEQSKYLLCFRFSLRIIVGSRLEVYDENSSSPCFTGTVVRTEILKEIHVLC